MTVENADLELGPIKEAWFMAAGFILSGGLSIAIAAWVMRRLWPKAIAN
jgi:hypothetical protein